MNTTLPTSQDLKASGVLLVASPDFVRLRWHLRQPLEDAIAVLASPVDPLSTQEPYTPHHPVASRPATDPPVSRLRVTLLPLDRRPDDWADQHRHHSDEAMPFETGAEFDPSDGRLLRCCGEERPPAGPYLDIIPLSAAAAADGGESRVVPAVTVGDVVSAVHPWMMGLEGEIRAAKGLARGEELPLPEVGMYVYPNRADQIDIRDTSGAGPGFVDMWWRMLASSTRKRLARFGGGEEWGVQVEAEGGG